MTRLRFYIAFTFFIFLVNWTFAQQWTVDQLKKANTAEHATYMSRIERDIIMYINLARLYPQQYLKLEVLDYIDQDKSGFYSGDSKYVKSLIKDLENRTPTHALEPDAYLYESAKCFSKESGDKGVVGHRRVDCKNYSYAAECCFYGVANANEVVLDLLVDEGVRDVGHRMICLDKYYNTIGVSRYSHKDWKECVVADFGVR
jgi:hypothetical protein